MKLILKYIFRYKRYLALSLVGVIGFTIIIMGIPTILKYVLNDALPNKDKGLLIELVFLMFACLLAGVLGELCMYYAYSRVSTNVVQDLRNDLFKKTQSFSHAEFNDFSVSSLITSATSDSYQIMIFTQALLRNVFIIPVVSISGFILIFTTSPQMFWIVFAIIPIIVGFIVYIGYRSRIYSDKQQKTLDKINLSMREGLTGLRVIRAFRNEEYQNERFEKENITYADYSKKAFRITALTGPGFFLIFNLMVAVIIWIGAIQVNDGVMDVGTLAASIEYIFHILFSFAILGILFIMYPRAAVSAERIQKILEVEPSISTNENGITTTKKKGYIEFENVTFTYGDGSAEFPVIRDVSFQAKPGETIAFIGSTGSGKSTLLQLIPRMYDVTKGRILLDGIDVRDFNIHALREKVGFIPQKAQLFSGTIADNLRVGKEDATLEEMEKAVEIAQAKDFIQQKELGFEEVLSEGGSNLSGGQKQRLAIARAIIKRPEIYVFDDSFSALDAATDLKLRNKINQELSDATLLIVAQRIGTILHADKILVLDEGKVVAQGTHKELLQNSPLYYDIAASQLSKEELE